MPGLFAGRSIASATAPRRSNEPEHEPYKYDRGRNLDPNETAKLTQNNFGLSAPVTRKRIADCFNTMRASPQSPFDPLRLVKERSAEQNPRQNGGADPKGMHPGVVFEGREPSVFAGLSHVTSCLL